MWSSLRRLSSLWTLSSLRTLSSLWTLSSLQTREICLERCVEPAGTREVCLQASWTCWNESGSSWFAWSLVRDVRDRWRDGSVTGDTRRPWPHPSPSFHPVNLGRVDSRFVREFIYRIACWRDRRSTSLKDMFWGVYLFLLFVYFVISVVVLISKVLFFILKISLFIFLNLSHSISSSC